VTSSSRSSRSLSGEPSSCCARISSDSTSSRPSPSDYARRSAISS
jgi:hypothetical protein